MSVVIFTRVLPCPYCEKAKELLKANGLEYEEQVIGQHIDRETWLAVYPHLQTVPQVFIDGEHIGGFDNLVKWFEENNNAKPAQS